MNERSSRSRLGSGRVLIRAIALAGLVALPGAAAPQWFGGGGSTQFDRVAATGQRVEFGKRLAMDTNCKTTGFTQYRLLTKPKLGQFIIRREQILLDQAWSADRRHCEGRKYPGVATYYQAGRRPGTDEFEVLRIDDDGKSETFKVRIDIH